MESVHFRATIGEDRIIRLPPEVQVPVGEVEVALTPRQPEDNPRLRAMVERLANASVELGIDSTNLTVDFAAQHDHYLHSLPQGSQGS